MSARIYHAFNTVTGKAYTGQTWDTLEQRASEHKRSANRNSKYPFHAAIRKYGFAAFVWTQLVQVETQVELDAAEVAFVKELKTKAPDGYNLTDGGRGSKGFKHTDEWKRAHSERMRLRKISDETRKRISEGVSRGQTGKKRGPHSEEHKRKISEANKGKSKPHKGVPRSLEARRKMSETKKRKKLERELLKIVS